MLKNCRLFRNHPNLSKTICLCSSRCFIVIARWCPVRILIGTVIFHFFEFRNEPFIFSIFRIFAPDHEPDRKKSAWYHGPNSAQIHQSMHELDSRSDNNCGFKVDPVIYWNSAFRTLDHDEHDKRQIIIQPHDGAP